MQLYLGTIFGLTLQSDINNFPFYTKLNYFDEFLDFVQFKIGDSRFRKLMSSPSLILIYKDNPELGNNPDTPQIINLEKNDIRKLHSHFNEIFKMGLWLLKDCCVYLPYVYKFKQQSLDIYYHEGKNAPTCADGGAPFTNFDTEDFKNASELLIKFNKLSKGIDINLTTIENDFVTAPSSLVPHNSIEKIDRGRHFVWCARHTTNILEKISWYIVALEALYKFDEKDNIKFNLSNRIPIFISNSNEDLEDISNTVKDGYTLRSNFLHGGKVVKAYLKDRKKHIEVSVKLDDILRRTFHEIIKSEEKFKILTNKLLFKTFFKQ